MPTTNTPSIRSCRLPSSGLCLPRVDCAAVALGTGSVLANGERDDRDREDVRPRVGDDLRSRREIRTSRRAADSAAESSPRSRSPGRPATSPLAAFTELFEISSTRPTKVVSGNASIWICVESPSSMRETSVSSTFTFVSSTPMSLIVSSVAASLLNVPMIAVSPCSTFRRVTRPRHRREDRRLRRASSARRAAAPATARLRSWPTRAAPARLRPASSAARPARRRRACGFVFLSVGRALVVALRLDLAGLRLRLRARARALRPPRARPRPCTATDRSRAGTGPCVTMSPSFTASRTMRPLMSAATSTLVCGCTCPLAVTEATRSRFCDGLDANFVALLPLFIAVSDDQRDADDQRRRRRSSTSPFCALTLRFAVIGVDGRPRSPARRTPCGNRKSR